MPCIQSLLEDYKRAGGVCSGSSNSGGYPESATPCDREGAPGDALCSAATESLLLEEDCINYVWNNKEEVQLTIWLGLIQSMCTTPQMHLDQDLVIIGDQYNLLSNTVTTED